MGSTSGRASAHASRSVNARTRREGKAPGGPGARPASASLGQSVKQVSLAGPMNRAPVLDTASARARVPAASQGRPRACRAAASSPQAGCGSARRARPAVSSCTVAASTRPRTAAWLGLGLGLGLGRG
eukprot:scaffold11538_cov79-Phaeocystis_antarctica.AAC.1